MKQTRYLYLLFTFLSTVVVVLVFGLYRLTSVDKIQTLSYDNAEAPSDLQAVLKEVSSKESWIYRMHLHQKQNIFSYPRTVYHINLN